MRSHMAPSLFVWKVSISTPSSLASPFSAASISASVMVPYMAGSRLPNMLRLTPCSTRTFMEPPFLVSRQVYQRATAGLLAQLGELGHERVHHLGADDRRVLRDHRLHLRAEFLELGGAELGDLHSVLLQRLQRLPRLLARDLPLSPARLDRRVAQHLLLVAGQRVPQLPADDDGLRVVLVVGDGQVSLY